nr:hypothetical protein [Tanacetum cinerariifolium]
MENVKQDDNVEANGNNGNDNGNGNRNLNVNNGGIVLVTRECTYQDFVKCQPLNFKGTKGVIVLTRWFEKIETKVGVDAAYAMTWKALIKLMTERFQELTMLCTKMVLEEEYHVKRVTLLRMLRIRKGSKMTQETTMDNFKRENVNGQNVVRAYTVGNNIKRKAYAGNFPYYNKCIMHHEGPCTVKCGNCKRISHMNRNCKSTVAAISQRASIGNKTGNNKAKARAYAIRGGGASPDSNIATGTFLLNNRYASMLFDSGTDRSFVSTTFNALLDVIPSTLYVSYAIELADGRILETNVILRGCMLGLLSHPFNIDLMTVVLGSFDVIINMDRLAKYHAVIICDEKIVRNDGGDERAATRLLHRATVTSYGSCDEGLSEVSLSDKSVQMNGKVYYTVGEIGGILGESTVGTVDGMVPQTLGTTFEARVRDYMAAHIERMERFKNAIFKQREEINDKMAKMFGLLKELTTIRAPEKVLIREEAKSLVTENVNSISLTRGKEEKSDKNNIATGDDTKKTNGSDTETPVKEAETENGAKNKIKNEPIKRDEKEKEWRHPALSLRSETYKHPSRPRIRREHHAPLHLHETLTDERLAETDIRLSLASHSYVYHLGIVEDVLVYVVGFVYLMDSVILDIKEEKNRPFILGTPFLTTAKAVIKFDKGTITLTSGKRFSEILIASLLSLMIQILSFRGNLVTDTIKKGQNSSKTEQNRAQTDAWKSQQSNQENTQAFLLSERTQEDQEQVV